MNNLCDKINKLPADQKKEVDDFVTFLIERNKSLNPKKSIKFEWRGGLKDKKNTCSSVEMQHSIRKEWEGNVSS